MTTYAVLIKESAASPDNRIYNRSAVAGSTVDLQNGSVFRLDTLSSASGCGEAWTVSAPSSSSSTLDDLWMAGQPENPKIYAGTMGFPGLVNDPRYFYNKGGEVFSAFKPQEGDIILMTADGMSNAKSTNTYVNATGGCYVMEWGASQTASALSFKYLETSYVSIPDGTIGTQRVTAYRLVCLAN